MWSDLGQQRIAVLRPLSSHQNINLIIITPSLTIINERNHTQNNLQLPAKLSNNITHILTCAKDIEPLVEAPTTAEDVASTQSLVTHFSELLSKERIRIGNWLRNAGGLWEHSMLLSEHLDLINDYHLERQESKHEPATAASASASASAAGTSTTTTSPAAKAERERTPSAIFRAEGSRKVSLQDFDLIAVIGRGSFGKVMKVRHKTTREILAMKVLKKDAIIKDNMVTHTMSEKNILQKVQHPFIVSLRYAFQT
eukprot:GEZU01021778.1.p1 GENE.GEZU01021778.1~~GEZU01021778.1.p1  ORF type:complete len:255 (+),score=69.26 GEZU01021778.1:670-1434(+)